MIRSNYHTHTVFSDGANTPEEMVLAAIDLGLESIGFSDHSMSYFHPNWSIADEKFALYMQTVGELKEKYKDRIRVYCGLEQDYMSPPPMAGLDYLIGSVHWLQVGEKHLQLDHSRKVLIDGINELYGGDPDALAEAYYDLVGRFAENPAITFIGHFDLITKFDQTDPLFLPTERYTAAWQNAAKKLIAAGKIFEMNTGAISRGYRTEPYPSPEILRFWGENGAKVIINSDSHHVSTLTTAFDRAEALALRYGCNLVDLFQ